MFRTLPQKKKSYVLAPFAAAICFTVLFIFPVLAAPGVVPLPGGLVFGPGNPDNPDGSGDPDAVAEAFLGIPYRVDGAVDENGVYTTFADRSRVFASPGLNCSGMVLGMSRFLLDRNITLDEAVRDRLGDSGPGASGGEDWDFGWDLILNISEGMPRRWLLPDMKTAAVEGTSGSTYRGYAIQSDATWQELPGRFQPGKLYLFSLTDYGRLKGYGLQHYHVGLAHVSAGGEASFYQTTGKGGRANRRDLKSAKGIESFRRSFADNGKTQKSVLILEVDLPPRQTAREKR